MKKKIAVLGSTGSIGNTLLSIVKKDKKNFEILLLTANKNYKKLLKQAYEYNVKNLIITNSNSYKKIKKIKLKKKINIFNNFLSLDLIFKKKIDYTMNAITGLDGLEPTLKIIKHTQNIAIANKESIICGWNLIEKELDKNKTTFIPVDSEHFTIWYAMKNNSIQNIENILITASGGSLLNIPVNKIKKLNKDQILSHPNWKMGKKITIDSATMMNKVFEVIEAKKIFNIDYKKISIIINPSSYIHSIIKFDNGLINIIAHDTTMKIPIFNSIYSNNNKKINSKKISIESLNNLRLQKVDIKKYPHVKILKKIPNKNSLFETILVSVNDQLVKLYLKNKLKFKDISKLFFKIIFFKEFRKYKKIKPKSLESILKLNEYVHLKINSMSI